jgi:hypothetical protein
LEEDLKKEATMDFFFMVGGGTSSSNFTITLVVSTREVVSTAAVGVTLVFLSLDENNHPQDELFFIPLDPLEGEGEGFSVLAYGSLEGGGSFLDENNPNMRFFFFLIDEMEAVSDMSDSKDSSDVVDLVLGRATSLLAGGDEIGSIDSGAIADGGELAVGIGGGATTVETAAADAAEESPSSNGNGSRGAPAGSGSVSDWPLRNFSTLLGVGVFSMESDRGLGVTNGEMSRGSPMVSLLLS